jgi:hypothetical protein
MVRMGCRFDSGGGSTPKLTSANAGSSSGSGLVRLRPLIPFASGRLTGDLCRMESTSLVYRNAVRCRCSVEGKAEAGA